MFGLSFRGNGLGLFEGLLRVFLRDRGGWRVLLPSWRGVDAFVIVVARIEIEMERLQMTTDKDGNVGLQIRISVKEYHISV
jgi:hypothetical protein